MGAKNGGKKKTNRVKAMVNSLKLGGLSKSAASTIAGAVAGLSPGKGKGKKQGKKAKK